MTGMKLHPVPHGYYDRDIIAGEVMWDDVCKCGHTREEHWGASGNRASFGGAACQLCWTCPTFRKAE